MALESGDAVVVVDTASNRKVAEIPVGGRRDGVAFTPDGARAFVTNRLDDTVSVIDVDGRKVIATLKTGDEPHGCLTDAEGRRLYVLNTSSDDISVFDAQVAEVGQESERRQGALVAGAVAGRAADRRQQHAVALRRTASRSFPRSPPSRPTARTVEDRLVVPGANLMMGIAWHPSGEFALATLNRTKNLVPMTRLMQGWTITNGLGDHLARRARRRGAARRARLGLRRRDRRRLHPRRPLCAGDQLRHQSRGGRRCRQADRHSRNAPPKKSANTCSRTIPASRPSSSSSTSRPGAARAASGHPDGKRAYVADSLDDTSCVIDLERMEAAGRIDLGGPKSVTKARFGEQLFHSANITLPQAVLLSLLPSRRPRRRPHLRHRGRRHRRRTRWTTARCGASSTPRPSSGRAPTRACQRQCGARLAVFFTRLAPFTPEELAAVDYYITTIPRPPNRYRPLGSPLSHRRSAAAKSSSSERHQRRARDSARRPLRHLPFRRPTTPTGACMTSAPEPSATARASSTFRT